MGGGKGGGGPEIPGFVKESHKMIGERSQKLHDVTSPVMTEGVKQLQSLLTTGGPGAQVPIIANMEEGQRRAFSAANKQIEEQMARGGGGAPRDPSFNRINELHNIGQEAYIRNIAPSIAGPLIGSAMGSALGGPGLAAEGYRSGAQALASGVRHPQQGSGGGKGSDLAGAAKTFGQWYASRGGGGGGGGSPSGNFPNFGGDLF